MIHCTGCIPIGTAVLGCASLKICQRLATGKLLLAMQVDFVHSSHCGSVIRLALGLLPL